MLNEFINAWDIIFHFAQGIFFVFVEVMKLFFTMPMLPFTTLALLGLGIKLKKR